MGQLYSDFNRHRSKGEITPLRSMLSDGLFRRVQTELKVIQAVWLKNVVTDIDIQSVTIIHHTSTPPFYSISVKIIAMVKEASVHSANDTEAALAEAHTKSSEIVETVWTFLRKASFKSNTKTSVFEGNCPNCGATLEVSQTARCTYCSALANSGNYDWVLCKISEASKFKQNNSNNIKGLAELMKADPAFCPALGEDIATYMFWRWIEAKIEKKMTLLRNVASPALLVEPRQKKDDSKIVKFQGIYKVHVDEVNINACQPNCHDGYHRFHAEIQWRCAYEKWDEPVNSHLIRFNLRKKSDVQLSYGLSYARCPNCGAALPENDSAICDYCQFELITNEKHWVLESTTTFH